MTLTIFISDKIRPFLQFHSRTWPEFVTHLTNRLMMGSLRYDPPSAEQNYLTLLGKELRAYKKTGNVDNLYNLVNYAYLETLAPQNKRFHFNEHVKSKRRKNAGRDSLTSYLLTQSIREKTIREGD